MQEFHFDAKPPILKWVAGIVSSLLVLFMAASGSLMFSTHAEVIKIGTTQQQFRTDITALKTDIKDLNTNAATKDDLKETERRLERRINSVEENHP